MSASSDSAKSPPRRARKAKPPPVPSAHLWVCESCGHVLEGVSPPDTCSWCTHEYFANMKDLEDERASDGALE